MTPDDNRHGTNAGYLAHIFDHETACTPCRNAHAQARRNLWRKRYLRRVDRLLIDSTGTIRRIHALMALGWRYTDIDNAAGHNSTRATWAHNITGQATVHIDTAEKIADVYEQLCMTPGPSKRVRLHAARKGWAPPLAWDDIDDPTEQPTRWEYRALSRRDVLTDLDERGGNIHDAIRLVKVGRDTLQMWCARNGMSDTYRRLAARSGGYTNQYTGGAA